MSIDRCTHCERIVDTDFDVDCYENPDQVCICEICAETDRGTIPATWSTTDMRFVELFGDAT